MTFAELLEKIREYYLNRFIEAIANHPTTICEPALLDSEGAIVCEGEFQLPLRLDIVVTESGQAAETLQIDTVRMLAFDPISISWEDDLTISIRPFKWNSFPVSLIGDAIESRPLIEWFQRWFNERDDSTREDLLGVVHFMSDPIFASGRIVVEIDMGSAPVNAFEDLLNAAAQCGAEYLEIGHRAA